MAETTERAAVTPMPRPTADAAALDYRPVSGWAVASFLVACIYILVVVVGGGIALYTWSPYLLPLWTLFVPALGLAVSLFAQFHVRRAEGTRVGHGLARVSWWTCLLLGAIYLSFYATTFMAVRQQADQFVRHWFDVLKAGHVNEAFLLTQHPEKVIGVSPADEVTLRARFDMGQGGTRGLLTNFKSSELSQLMQQGGAEGRLESLGVQNWEFTEGSYRVTRQYKILTPEGEIEATITAIGTESKSRAYEGRKWYLFWDNSTLTGAKLTDRGKRLYALRGEGAAFVDAWRKNVLRGTPQTLEVAYGETQPPAERAAKQAAFREGKQELKDFLKLDQLRAANDEMRKGTVQALHELFRTKKEDELRVLLFDPAPGGSRRWEEVRDRVQFTYDANVIFGIGRKPLYRADVSIVVETEPGAAATGETKSWRVVRIEPILVVDPKDHMLKID